MIANFYIIPESFSNENIDNEQFLSSLESFVSDYNNIVEYKDENRIIIQEHVFNIVLPNGKNLGEFLYSEDPELGGKDRSLRQFLGNIFNKLPYEDVSIEIIKEKIQNNSIENCFGVISLTKIEEIADENQVIYDKDSWFSFRRYHLGLYFGNAKYFIDECKKYYPKLFFHENNYTSTAKILDGFSNKIVYNLSALNDKLPNLLSKKNYNNHTELLTNFSKEASLDGQASLEGRNKDRLGFSFINKKGEIENIVCEPHMKLCFNDTSDGHYYHHRIYFYFGKEDIENSKILVGHIGKHL